MRKFRNARFMALSLLSVILAAVICGVILMVAEPVGGYFVDMYFKNPEGNNIEYESHSMARAELLNNRELFKSVVLEMREGPKSNTLLQDPFGETVIEESYLDEEEAVAYITLSENYYDKSYSDRLLLQGCIVYTLTSLDFVDSVSITSAGRPVGCEEFLNRQNLLLNPDILPEKVNYRTIKLYFTDSGFKDLYAENRLVEVKQSIEYSAVEQLLAGPQDSSHTTAIPSSVKLINTTVEDGVCYVNLSSAFLNKGGTSGITETQIYQIVNTLTEFKDVDYVQIYIEGRKVNEKAGDADISKELERKDSLIKGG